MLKVLVEIDEKILKLVIAVKSWAKAKNLIGRDGMSSYAFVLTVFHYLFKKERLDGFFK